jgi:hypothetical protein
MEEIKNSTEFSEIGNSLGFPELPKLPEGIDFSKIKIPRLPALRKFIPKKLPMPPKFNKNRRR